MNDVIACLMLEAAAIQAEIEGMKAENLIRNDQGKSLAYDEAAFCIEAKRLAKLARIARASIEKQSERKGK